MLKRQGLPLTLICALATLAMAPSAHAAPTRAEYAGQVNAVCTTAQVEAEAFFDKYFKVTVGSAVEKPRKVKVKKAMRFWANLYRDLMALDQRMIDGIAAVAAAPGDEALVASWVTSMQAAHDLSQRAIRRTMDGLRFLYAADPTGGDDDNLTKGERKKLGRHLRRIKRANKPAIAEAKRSSALALQLGATECAGEEASASARAASPLGP